MCGLAAAISWPDAAAAVTRIIDGLAHRGALTDPLVEPAPDVALCTRRLPIVDADGGQQPKLSHDGALLVALNGEIYNHAALRAELEVQGVRFQTASDTEVLANVLRMWGPKGVQRLRGMYAFIAYDLRDGSFLAGRDPFGEKPLYLIQEGRGFLFASEIAPLLRAHDRGDVLLLPPGYLLSARGPMRHYLFPAPAEAAATADPDALEALLRRAVHRCTPLDRPVGLLFSGGIDSTLVAHFARELRPDLKAYVMAADEAPDLPYARLYAETSGLEVTYARFTSDPAERLAEAEAAVVEVESFEPSVIRPSLCNRILAAAIAKDGVDVALTGEGADELFAGYVPMELAYGVSDSAGEFVREQCLGALNRSALQRTDRALMRRTIEARSPFLDLDLAAYAATLGAGALLRSFQGRPQGKAPLRGLFDRAGIALPEAIRDRAKRPLNEGAGLDRSQTDSDVRGLIERRVSDADFKAGQLKFRDFALATKEEFYYLDRLAEAMDVHRVPHLKGRLQIAVPTSVDGEALQAFSA